MGPMHRLPLFVLLGCLAASWLGPTAPAAADPPAQPKAKAKAEAGTKGPKVPAGGYLPTLRRLGVDLERAGARPTDGFGGLRFAAWKLYQKPRTGRMRRRLETMAQAGRWTMDGKDRAVAVAATGWSPMVRSVSAFFSEIGTIQAGYAKVKVSPDRAIRSWIRRHPRPEPVGRVPSEDALDRINGDIRLAIVRGYVVPTSWYVERDRLLRIVAAERAAARERNRLAYVALRRETIEGLTRRAEQTRRALRDDGAALDGVMKALRALIADLQTLEQRRLEARVAEAPGDEAWRKKAAQLLKRVERGRRAGGAFSDPRPSRYGSLLRQQWLLPRDKLLAWIKKAERAAARNGE